MAAATTDATLSTLSSALSSAAKVQMRRINFALEDTVLDTPGESLERLVNLYAEQAPNQARSATILRSRPGLALYSILGTGPILAMNADLPNQLLTVSGVELYETANNITNLLGVVGPATSTYPNTVTIATGPTLAVVCVPPRAYSFGQGVGLHQIVGTTDNPFPGASSVAYIDGYFVFTAHENSAKFFCTNLFDPDTLEALDFAYADAQPNIIRRVVTHLQRLWFFGESGVEIWYDSGDSDFPFRRDSGGFIPHGCVDPSTVVECDGSLFWLGMNGTVMRTNGYAANRVSTHAIEAQIHQFSNPLIDPSSVTRVAFTFIEDGHVFYALSLNRPGTQGRTWVYDCATKLWHERSSSPDGEGRWRVNAAALFGNIPVYGEMGSGRVYTSDIQSSLDEDVAPMRIAVSPPLWGGTRRAYMDRLEIEMDSGQTGETISLSIGTQPTLAATLSWTDDKGVTWKGNRQLALSGKRVVTTRLGSFRERSLRLQILGRVRIHAVDAQVQSGVD